MTRKWDGAPETARVTAELIGDLLDEQIEADELVFRYLRELVVDYPELADYFRAA